MAAQWTWEPGQHLTREERRDRYGGGLYGGIEPSAQSPNVFVYSDPSRGEAYGYKFDGWNEDRTVFLYTGEGTEGDQQWSHGNAAILNHHDHGRALRLFVADGMVPGTAAKNQLYVGEFEVDPDKPFVYDTAPDRNGDELRRVIVFRLRPVGPATARDQDISAAGDATDTSQSILVDPEAHAGDTFEVAGSAPSVAERRESALVKRFEASLTRQGHETKRWQLRPPNAVRSLVTDTYDLTADELFEAKGSARREAVRMVIGQLYDYELMIGRPGMRLAGLFPSRPADDLIALLHRAGISCVYETETGAFERQDP